MYFREQKQRLLISVDCKEKIIQSQQNYRASGYRRLRFQHGPEQLIGRRLHSNRSVCRTLHPTKRERDHQSCRVYLRAGANQENLPFGSLFKIYRCHYIFLSVPYYFQRRLSKYHWCQILRVKMAGEFMPAVYGGAKSR